MTLTPTKSFYLSRMSYIFNEKAKLYDILNKKQVLFCHQQRKTNEKVI
jgi:hypothetical protein